MKTSYLYLKFIMSLALLTTSLHATAPAATTVEQANKILKAVDGICGDAWCEGDFAYHFQKVILKESKNEALFLFRMSQQYPLRLDMSADPSFRAQINRRFYDVSCTIPGYSSYEGIMASEYSVQPEVYASLGACIGALEKRLQQVNKDL